MITGDNVLVATAVAQAVGIETPEVLTGAALRTLSAEALRSKATTVHVFAEIEPNHKESIVLLSSQPKVIRYSCVPMARNKSVTCWSRVWGV